MGVFQFKQFSVDDSNCGMKIGTDAVLLGAWADVSGFSSIVDVGCGSGVIALMMAQRSEMFASDIVAVDINAAACDDARVNVLSSPWASRISVCEMDVTQSFPEVTHPLLIVSNPPFFNETLHSPVAERALARHGEDFDVAALISLSGRQLTDSRDSLTFIAPAGRDDEIEFLLSVARLIPVRKARVYSKKGKKPIRTLWQVGRESSALPALKIEDISLRDETNCFTDEYIRLTAPFYLDKHWKN